MRDDRPTVDYASPPAPAPRRRLSQSALTWIVIGVAWAILLPALFLILVLAKLG